MKNGHPFRPELLPLQVVFPLVVLAGGQAVGAETGDGEKKGRVLAEEKRTQSATFAVG